MNNRSKHEFELAHSLSRYVGYTTGAYGVGRFISILEFLAAKPYSYHFELIEFLKSQDLFQRERKKLTEDYAGGIVDFITALGLIARGSADARSQINPKLVKYECTALGRTLRAATTLGMTTLKNLVLGITFAENDADLYCLVLEYFKIERAESINSYFERRIIEQRERRVAWLNEIVSHKYLRDKIISNIGWIDSQGRQASLKLQNISESFVRHHLTPRKGWAQELGHIDVKGHALTLEGLKYFKRFSTLDTYEWIGPGKEALSQLKFDIVPKGGLVGPPIKLFRGEFEGAPQPSRSQWISLLNDVAQFMENAFPYIKLASANQATIDEINLYIACREYENEYIVDSRKVIEEVIKANEQKFAVLSSRNSKIGYYQLRR